MNKPSPLQPGPAAASAAKPELVGADALHLAGQAAKRAGNRTAQIRRRFVQRADPFQPDPPLVRMLRGGRGGEVRLKVYLTQLWIGAGGAHDVPFPASLYARLLDLPDPYGNGARRVNDALTWLHTEGLIDLARRPGLEPIATLLCDDGSRRPYEVPGGAEKDEHGKTRSENIYFRLPPSFWTRGWVAYLPAPATAMLLVLLARSQNKHAEGMWISPSQLTENYGLSDDTRRRGVTVLEDTGLVYVGRQAVDPDFGFRRVRNTYNVEPALLDCPIQVGEKDLYVGIADLFEIPKAQAWAEQAAQRLKAIHPET